MSEAPEEQGPLSEIERAREAYGRRDRDMPFNDRRRNIYHPRHSLGRLFNEHHRDLLIDGLNTLDIDLEEVKVLDVGCGYGGWLRHLVELGASPDALTGIDLSASRIEFARQQHPGIRWSVHDGERLPFPDGSFGLVLQTVVFSSVLDEGVRLMLASEMERVLEPGGWVLWMDVRHGSPGKLQGFQQTQASAYFPSCTVAYARPADPHLFRLFHPRPWLAKALYLLFRGKHDAWFMMLRKGSWGHANGKRL